jgi:hypothetical protein
MNGNDPMNGKLIRYEAWFYFGAFLLAAGLRLVNLGSLPLSDREALEALKALALANGNASGSSQPLYTLLTAGLFSVFGSGEFLARLIPALTGCLLLSLPVLLRDKLGRLTALILAYGLALDPALVTIARQAGSAMPAVSFSLLALTFFWLRRGRPAGIFAGLAVLAGTSFWFGLIGFLIAYLANDLLSRSGSVKADLPETGEGETKTRRFVRDAWTACGVTLLLGGGLFLIVPSGYSMIVSGLLSHISGWQGSAGATVPRLLIALIVYQAAILLLGLTEGISAWIQRNPERRFAAIALLAYLLLLILYPGRQMQDAAWVVVLLWLLAAWLTSRIGDTPREVVLPILAHAALIVALLIFLILHVTWVLGGFGGLDVTRSLIILAGVLVILIISFLVAYGWGLDVAARGAFVGIGLVLLSFMVSFSVSAGGVNGRSSPDLWQDDYRVTGAGALLNDLNTVSLWNTGVSEGLVIEVAGFDTPSMRWALRQFPEVSYVDALSPEGAPDVVITDFIFRPELSDRYRGETFAWYTTADWGTLDIYSFLDWTFHRKVNESTTNLILWVRQDLFLENSQSIIQ